MACSAAADKTPMTTDGYRTRPSNRWIHITDPKFFSRLLYTNPVCFLTTFPTPIPTQTPTPTAVAPVITARSTITAATTDGTKTPTSNPPPPTTTVSGNTTKPNNRTTCERSNAMVVSWLTATNNTGKFIMSVNRNRHTFSLLISPHPDDGGDENGTTNTTITAPPKEFVLSVPIAGMEQLVLNVGRTSGKWGTSKFPADHSPSPHSPSSKKRRRKFHHGVDGLVRTALGSSVPLTSDDERDGGAFAVGGTVAHMRCRIDGIVDGGRGGGLVDEGHGLVAACVCDAYVDRDYWDGRGLFCPKRRSGVDGGSGDEGVSGGRGGTVPPYLTFFGSQTFGYVVPDYEGDDSRVVEGS